MLDRAELKKQLDEAFPRTEDFLDCCGTRRIFRIHLGGHIPHSYDLRAIEVTDGSYGYQFEIFAEADPFIALGNLRRKIRKGISRRFLVLERDERTMAHNELAGFIAAEGLVVDGALLTWEQFQRILQTREGFEIKLQTSSCSDDDR